MFKTLDSNDYDCIIEQLIEYFKDVRIKCSYCQRKFISSLSIKTIFRVFIKWLKEVRSKRLKEMSPLLYFRMHSEISKL